ncbi:hypothetical protein B0H14DRAFT_2812695 [Mycena olivaceomarginata]|nr:hypothetical protein B0H14DRAFT_2812695 [Mycena olivaceomarginata]
MPAASVPGTLRLHSLRVSGDCKILVPLGAWLVPRGALAALYTLVLDVTYLTDDCVAPGSLDVQMVVSRSALVLAAAPSLRELTLQLDPLAPFRLASFPRLRTLNLHDGYDASIDESLAWLAAFLLPPASPSSSVYPPRDTYSAFEELSFNHSMRREDLLAVPAATWRAIEGGLLGFTADGVEGDAHPRHHAHPHLRTRAAMECGRMQDSGADESLAHFSRTVRERLPGLMGWGVLVVGR